MADLTFDTRDEFQRRGIAEKVISLLCSDIDISPMVIDGGWGTGKTEFCQKLINLMEQRDSHHLIYVDAFQADHADEPLLTILSAVVSKLPETERDGFITKVIPAVRFGLKTALKAGVGHLLRQDTEILAEEFDNELKQAADKVIDVTASSLIKDHVEANKNLEALQDALKEIADQKSIVLFIDELDRCRPDFAVSMLEVIKHTFNVENVSFVLITNTNQLRASINHCYGSDVDAQRYLEKFLKFTISLPISVDRDLDTKASVEHYKNLINKSQYLEKSKLENEAFVLFITHLILEHSLSLRDIETIVRNAETYQLLTKNVGFGENVNYGYRMIRLFSIILFSLNPTLSNNILNNNCDAKELGDFLGEKRADICTGDYPYPSESNVIAVILGQECKYSIEAYTPEEGDQNGYWTILIRDFFGNGAGVPRTGNRSKIVIDTLNMMNLYS